MTNEKDIPGLSYFDRAIGSLHGLPDVVSTKATTLRSHEALLELAHKIARSACLQQCMGDKCICFSCEASRIIAHAEGK